METEYRLDDSRTVTLDASGEATVLGVGPVSPGERWVIELMSVNTSASCYFQVFRGKSVSLQDQIDSTTRGDLDTSPCNIPLRTGESVSFKWSKGSSGASGVIHFEGKRFVPGRRSY